MQTLGISPKVLAFLSAVGGPGVLLLVLALIIHDDQLRTVALTLLGATAAGGAAGAKAGPGDVVPVDTPASDDALSDEAKAAIPLQA